METNECLSDNGGCWQDKAANVTACRVCMNRLMIFTGHQSYVLKHSLVFLICCDQYLSRTLFVAECVNAPHSMACNLKEMATATVNVIFFLAIFATSIHE